MTVPLVSAVNLTPRVPELASPESIVAGVPKSRSVSSGVTAEEGAEAEPVPRLFVAETVNV